jgi:hypothetical protein
MTAVEFIEKAYNEAYLNMWTHNVPIHKDFIPNLFKQAKEMEQEQIEDAFCEGVDDEYEHHINNKLRKNSEQYYNETFKNK